MTPVEEIFERIAVALERQATALESIANILDVVTEPPEADEVGNTVKYIARAERKGSALEDLKKAQWYLEREIAKREQDLQIATKVTRHHQAIDQDLRLRTVQEMPQPGGESEVLGEVGKRIG